MSVFFFTADTHFGHERIMRYCNRPFASADEMNECLFANWEATVRQSDTVYHLGDVAFGNRERVQKIVDRFRKLPGKKYLIPGNHDWRYPDVLFQAFEKVLPQIYETTVAYGHGESRRLVLCHYPMLIWNGLYRGSIQLYGHVHGRIPGNTAQTDVGVDVWGFTPVRLSDLLTKMKFSPEFRNQAKEHGLEEEEDEE